MTNSSLTIRRVDLGGGVGSYIYTDGVAMVAVDDVSVNNGWVGAGWGMKQLTDVIKKIG